MYCGEVTPSGAILHSGEQQISLGCAWQAKYELEVMLEVSQAVGDPLVLALSLGAQEL